MSAAAAAAPAPPTTDAKQDEPTLAITAGGVKQINHFLTRLCATGSVTDAEELLVLATIRREMEKFMQHAEAKAKMPPPQ